MADKKFDQFTDGGAMQVGDIPVGLRTSDLTKNFKFDFPGAGIKDSSGNWLFQYETAGASSVNYLKFVNSVTTLPAQLTADGDDTNVDIAINPKGAGRLILDGLKWPASDGAPNQVITTDGSGNLGFSTVVLTSTPPNPSAVLLSNTSSDAVWSTTLTNGQLIIGNTGNTPSVATLTAGAGISIVNGAGTITISGGGGGYNWTEVTGTSQAMSVNSGYIANNAGLVTLTLPATASVGDTIIVQGKGSGGWRIAQNDGQTIHFGTSDTTTGTGGYLESTNRYDSIELICITADTDFAVLTGVQGVLTVV